MVSRETKGFLVKGKLLWVRSGLTGQDRGILLDLPFGIDDRVSHEACSEQKASSVVKNTVYDICRVKDIFKAVSVRV